MRVLYFLLFFFAQNFLFSVDFDDLKEEKEKVYGSEKDEKFVYDAFFSEWEKWPRKNPNAIPTHSSFHLFWFINSTDYPKYKKSEFLPFYSITESKIDARYKSHYLFLSNYSQSTKEHFDYSFIPFYFSGKDQNSNYTTLPFLLTYISNENSNDTKKEIKIFPFFYSNKTEVEKTKSSNSVELTPLYYYSKEKINQREEETNFYPILPLYYENKNPERTHKNILGFLDYSTDKLNTFNRFFLMPFYFYEKNSYQAVFPLYLNYQNEASKTDNTIIPFIYSSRNGVKASTYKNFLLFFSYEFDEENNHIGLMIPPLRFYKKDSYSIWFPVVFKFGEDSEKVNGTRYGLFYYNTWTQDKETFYAFNYYSYNNSVSKENSKYIFPFYYSWENGKEKASSNLVLPLYYYKKNSETHSYLNVLLAYSHEYKKSKLVGLTIFPFIFHADSPEEKTWQALIWYSNENKKNKNYFKTLAPLYYDWKTDSSEGDLFFPFSITLKFPDKKKFHLNLTGFSRTISSGVLKPDFSVDAGLKDGYSYIDIDSSWLYYVTKVSTRVSSKIFEKENLSEAKIVEAPKLSKKREFTRENSFNFFGFNALFNSIAYERGDSKRHIRFFPLAWLTWDEKNSDKITHYPFYINYKEDDFEYQVVYPFLFPVYAYQKTAEEKRTGYGLIIYHDEKIEKDNRKEKSILWPLINFYTSNIDSGHRFLPFYVHKKSWNENEVFSRTISLAYYSDFYTNKNGLETGSVYSPFWFYFKNKNKLESDISHFTIPIYYQSTIVNENTIKNKFMFLPFPFYKSSEFEKTNLAQAKSILWMVPGIVYRDRFQDELHWNIFLIFNSYESNIKSNLFLAGVYYHDKLRNEKQELEIKRWLLPFFYYDRKYPKEELQYDKIKLYTPLLFYSSLENKSNGLKKYDYYIPWLLFYRKYSSIENSTYNNFAFLFYTENSEKKSSGSLTPLISWEKNLEQTSNYFIPFYYFKKAKSDVAFLSLLYTFNSSEYETTHKVPALPILFYKNGTNTRNDWNLLSFIYSRSQTEADFSTESFGVFPFYRKSKEIYFGSGLISKNYLVPFYYFHSEKNSTHLNIALINDYKFENNQLTRFVFLPFWYSKSPKENAIQESSFHAFPFYFSGAENGNSYKNILGVVYHYTNDSVAKTSQHRLLLSSFDFAFSPKETKTKIFYGLIGSQQSKENSQFNFFWLGFNNSKTERVQNYLPFYYYENKIATSSKTFASLPYFYKKTESETNHYFPALPFLYYANETNSSSDWNILSILFSRKNQFDQAYGVFPIFRMKSNKNSDNEENSFLSLLYYQENRKSPKLNSKEHFFPIIPILYYNKYSEYETNLNLFSFIHYRKDSNESSHGLFPIYYSYSSNEFEKNTLLQNFYGLVYNQSSNDKEKKSNQNLFLSSVHLEQSKENNQIQLLYGLIEYNKNKTESDFNFLWFGYKDYFSNLTFNFLPLYYSNKTKDSKKTIFLPTLTYIKSDSEEEYHSTGLSILYSHKKNLKTLEEETSVLLGILYFKDVKPDERGYEGIGSLWGVLWEYKTEKVKNYKKFSILKIPIFREKDDE